MTLKELKFQQKARAALIKADRMAYRSAQRAAQPSPLKWGQYSLVLAAREYRLHHIAYCMSRGTPYERIEPKVREGNEPDWKKIDAIRQVIAAPTQEVQDGTPVCAGP